MQSFEGYLDRVQRSGSTVKARLVAGGFDPRPAEAPVVAISVEHPAEGEALYEAARSKGLEGIIAKLRNSTYAGARTSTWVKLKIVSEVDAVIAGYTEGRGSRKFFGALVLGLYEGRELKFIGSVGTGFDESKQEEITKQLEELRTEKSPFAKPPGLRENVDWVEPKLIARVKYAN